MATFDPTKYGAVPVQSSFDPSKYGAVPVSTPEPTTIPEQKKPNYFQRVGQSFSDAALEITKSVTDTSSQLQNTNQPGKINSFMDTLKNTGSLLRTGLRTTGSVAETAFSPVVELPVVKQTLSGIASNISKIPGVQDILINAEKLSQQHPELARDIKNIVDIATLGTGKVVEKPLAKEAELIAKDAAGLTKSLLTPSEEAITNKVQSLFQKSIKPTAKKTLGQTEKYQDDLVSALKTIKENSPNLNIQDATGELVSGRTPQTINELAQAVDQTKDVVFKKYDALAKEAGQKGAFIDPAPIANELDIVVNNKALQFTNPEIVKYAQDTSKRLRDLGSIDTETAQEIIKNYNNSLKAFYRNPSYDTASRASIDAGIVNNFRSALDKSIEGATGKEYQAIKNQYSALKSIENDVVRAANRDARKNVKGLLDYTDIFTGGQMLSGIMTLNPAMFTKGAVEKGIKEYIKFLNDPNRAIDSIFKKLDTQSFEFTPKSTVGKYIADPKVGASIADVTKKIHPEDINLMQEFIDHARLNNPLTENKFKMVEKLAQKFGISMDKGINGVANKFDDILRGNTDKITGTKVPGSVKSTIKTTTPLRR